MTDHTEPAPLLLSAGLPVPCNHCGETVTRNEQSRQWVDEEGYALCFNGRNDHVADYDAAFPEERDRTEATA